MSEQLDGHTIHREFAVDLEATGDGRTLDVRVVPYNVAQRVVDPVWLGGTGIPYKEMWIPGAFDNQTNAAHRVKVLVNFEHEAGIGGVIGRGESLRDTGDALEGTFRMFENADADKVLELVNEGIVGGVSLEAKPKKTVNENGVVKRVKAHLINVALCRMPAYPDAQVLAVREANPEFKVETLEVVELPARKPEVEERLERIGFQRLDRRTVVRTRWDPAPARFTDEEYVLSCLIDRGGEDPAKERCSLPLLEPNGDLNAHALTFAAEALTGSHGGVQRVSAEQKGDAARMLIRYMRQADMEPSRALLSVAYR